MSQIIHPQPSLLDALARGPLVADGALGTQLYERGVFVNRSFEEVCLSNPTLVRRVHEDYLAAGAQLIETHTFAANRIKLGRHGLGDQVGAINAAAVQIARDAAEGRAFVSGAVGPSGLTPGVMTRRELESVQDAFREQISALVHAGVDLIILETFRLLSELRLALEVARSITSLPIVAQASFDAEERTGDGADPGRVVEVLKDLGADVAGANCIEGPKLLFSVAQQMLNHEIPISIMPNAGYPRKQDDRMIYMATPEYFGVYARRFFEIGVSIVGGCCGTGPEHIARIANAARAVSPGPAEIEVGETSQVRHRAALGGVEPIPVPQRSALAAKIDRVWRERVNAAHNPLPLSPESFVVSVEVNPPAGIDPAESIQAARMLQAHGVDVINIADGPRATVRMSNQALGILTQQQLGMEVILHMCCRDRNLLGLQSDLLANHVLGVRNLVVVTGDPPKMGDYPHATGVYDLDSVGLLRMIQGLNRGLDPAGKPMGAPTSFFAACGAEPAALDYDRELRRLEAKRDAGAQLIMTQPVYDPRVLERFLNDTRDLHLPILVGLLPLASWRNAEFLHNEVPGMQIPEPIRERMRRVEPGPRARQEGVRIAQEALLAVADRVVGAYIMPPFKRYAAALEILTCVGYAAPPTDPA